MSVADVLVVGAGPVGLTAACGLLQHGVSVRVIDRAPTPATTSRANILHARGVEVLDRLGALGDLRERSVSAIGMTFHLGTKPLATIRFGEVEGARLSALLVSQAEVEAALRTRLSELGGTVEWQRELVDAAQDSGGVTVTLRDGKTLRAGRLLGCDGAHSTVRELAGIGFPGAPVTDQWLLADVHADWDADRTGSSGWYHRDGLFFAMPMRAPTEPDTGDLWRLMADVALPEGERLDEHRILEHFRHLLPARTGLTGVRLREVRWASVFRIHRRLAERYRSGRILLAGDAAHIHSPFGGQGMNTGIGDAENLAWKLALVARNRAEEALLDTYQDERRPLAEEVLRNTTANTRFLTAEGRWARFLRDRVLTPLMNLSVVQRRATWLASQLWVHYRNGSLGSRWGRGLRPGDRVRDRECRRADGSTTRLHAELGGQWALLVPKPDDAGETARQALGEHLVSLTPLGQPWNETWLVRPDGHLAWRGPAGADGLGQWLHHALRHGRSP